MPRGRKPGRLERKLELALKDDSTHKGSFAFGMTMHSAPNPGLEIRTLGMIGLPLTHRDVESIKGVSSRAPFGHGEKSVVDSTVRDTWEIDANQISIKNSMWTNYLEGIVDTVWKELGVAPYSVRPKCELYKLLLYETGSHFLPHQDTEKAPGMFATIIIVLPSMYTGGEVRVVHGKEGKVFDYASTSQLSTSVLAWYADVVHEVKPITSGFRLALSYNLIQPNGIHIQPPPLVLSASSRLRQTFSDWSEGMFDDSPDIVCYKLQHEYSMSNLARGFACLKGIDAHKGARLREAAEGLGISIGLGQFVMHIVAEDEECDYSYYKRRRYACWYDEPDDVDDEEDEDSDGDDDEDRDDSDDDDDEEEETYESSGGGDELDRSMTVSGLMDLDGKTVLSSNKKIHVNGKRTVLIPKNAFRGEDPDEVEHSGYTGNAGASIEKWYRRTVLVLYLTKNETRLLLDVGGAWYAVHQLQTTNLVSEPSQNTKDCIDYLLKKQMGFSHSYPFSYSSEHLPVVDVALKWNSFALWEKAANECSFKTDPHKFGWEKVVTAWNKFGCEALRSSLEESLRNLPLLRQRVQLLDAIKAQDAVRPRASTTKWCDEQAKMIVSTLPRPAADDLPTYLSIMEAKGSAYFIKRIMPQLVKHTDTFSFFVAFARSLQTEGGDLNANPDDTVYLINESFNAAVKQWKCAGREYYGASTSVTVSRIEELIRSLVPANRLTLLRDLFMAIIRDRQPVVPKISETLVPVVPYLVRMLKEHDVQIDSEICKTFFRWLIENYMQFVLGGRNSKISNASIRKLGCGNPSCYDCRVLDEFITSAQHQHEFREVEKRRKHLESRIDKAPDMMTYRTDKVGKPYGLRMTKRKEIIEAQHWHRRQRAAVTFLKDIGGDDAIRRILGEKIADVRKALTGEKLYVASAFTKEESVALSLGTGTSDFHAKPITGIKRKSSTKSILTSSQLYVILYLSLVNAIAYIHTIPLVLINQCVE